MARTTKTSRRRVNRLLAAMFGGVSCANDTCRSAMTGERCVSPLDCAQCSDELHAQLAADPDGAAILAAKHEAEVAAFAETDFPLWGAP